MRLALALIAAVVAEGGDLAVVDEDRGVVKGAMVVVKEDMAVEKENTVVAEEDEAVTDKNLAFVSNHLNTKI
jgi:hypothetical protein